jgi:hypothetical protein
MSTITVPRKIIIKAIVTDSFKTSFKAQLETLRQEMADHVDKIKTEESRLLLNVGGAFSQNELNSSRSKLAYDRQQQEAGIKEIDEKLKEMETLKEGSIYPYTQLDSFVDIQEGDNLFEKLSPGEITIRDGIIIAIKE